MLEMTYLSYVFNHIFKVIQLKWVRYLKFINYFKIFHKIKLKWLLYTFYNCFRSDMSNNSQRKFWPYAHRQWKSNVCLICKHFWSNEDILSMDPMTEPYFSTRGDQVPRGHVTLLVTVGEEPRVYWWYMNFYILDEKSVYEEILG